MSVPTRTDPSRPEGPARRAVPTPSPRAGDGPAAAETGRATVAARLAGTVVVLAVLLVAFGGWLIVLL